MPQVIRLAQEGSFSFEGTVKRQCGKAEPNCPKPVKFGADMSLGMFLNNFLPNWLLQKAIFYSRYVPQKYTPFVKKPFSLPLA